MARRRDTAPPFVSSPATMQPLKLLTEVCSIPTAPFAEQHVVRYVERFVAARPKLKLSRDRHGNLLIELQAGKRKSQAAALGLRGAHGPSRASSRARMLDDADARGRTSAGGCTSTTSAGRRSASSSDGREIAGTVTDATSSTHDRLTVPDRCRSA